ncbi:hypothetical protein [Agrobacterium rosae]|uniref:Uncharacterized protein n=1 Tax=Agrobacterium rosae TaxID=1972867 RepID=A0AAW9F7L4_9HYPH|nr:hypothetical protein [Agrobacterium rosae]MDX8301455.1 hypothetical protein [Agrobacterium rosae]MDX8312967.1 hypothetical protein [Agrobacterium rosae]
MKRDPKQMDFFREAVFPTRTASEKLDIERFRSTLKREMARAIRECKHDRETIAAKMAYYLGLEKVSKAALDAYTAESKTAHDISMPRFKAFVRATNANWLWDIVVSDDGLLLLEGDEARLAEISRVRQAQRELAQELKLLQATPVTIRRGHK